jgi:hypothetical protein
MLKLLQKYALIISVALLVVLLVTLVFYPDTSQILSVALLVFGLGAAILFTIHRNWETKRDNELTNAQFARNTFLDLLGLALTMGAAIWLGRMAGGYAGQAVGITSTALSARVAGILAAMLAGFAGALVAGRVWGRISEPLRSEPETG